MHKLKIRKDALRANRKLPRRRRHRNVWDAIQVLHANGYIVSLDENSKNAHFFLVHKIDQNFAPMKWDFQTLVNRALEIERLKSVHLKKIIAKKKL